MPSEQGTPCAICRQPVETNKYVRVKAMVYVGDRRGRAIFESSETGSHIFIGLDHTLDEIYDAVMHLLPPQPGIPVRLLWNPGKGLNIPPGFGVEQTIKGARMITVQDPASLKQALGELVPPAHRWQLDRNAFGVKPDSAVYSLQRLLGDDHELTEEGRVLTQELKDGGAA